jgi:16S rRNA (cytosine967-C5)-methyltransferase
MNARRIALDVLERSRAHEAFAGELLESAFAKPGPADEHDGANRRLVTQLVFGVLRRQGTLDALLLPFLNQPLERMHPNTLEVLRLGVFQLAFLTQIPRHAAVNETIELLPTNRGQVRNFANAILRRVSDLVTDDATPYPGPDALPVGDGFRQLERPILPDPRRNPEAYLAAAFSLPLWLAERWFDRHGFDECVRLGFWFNSPPGLWLRVNRLRKPPDGVGGDVRAAYLRLLSQKDVPAEPTDHPQGVKLLGGATVRELPGYDDGLFTVQDATAMRAATALNPQPGWKVLDLCAAPGGKTTHLAELMHNSGKIVACDIVPQRLDTVMELCRRLRITIVEPKLLVDGTDAPEGPFDAVLADVPCSNTGVLARRPEVRWRLQPQEFPHLIELQTRLLNTALDRVKPGGVVLYSTCSIEPEENQGVVRAVLDSRTDAACEADHVSIPGLPADGGFWARLRKR